MEVKPGYKQTEVGVIPEEWEVKSVRELAQIKTGPFGTLLKASEYSGNEGVPLISVGEVGDGRFKVTEHTPLVPAAVVRRLSQYLLRTGDVVFGRKGAVERSALVTENENGWFLGSDGISIRPHRDCYPPYLACQFQRYEVQAWLLQNATGTTMASLNQAILGRVQIPYAPLPEQRAIATALSDVDALLGALDRLIAKKRDLKQASMQQLLTGQTRLPGFHGEWEVKRLDEIADIRSGGTPSTTEPRFWDGEVPWCTPTDITALNGRKYLSETSRRITEHGLKSSSAEMIPVHSIVMTSRATIGECAINSVPVSTNQGFKNLIPFKPVDVDFLYYLLTTQKQGFISLCGGSTFLEIGKGQLVAFEVRLPTDKGEQTAIAAVLTEMDAELAVLEQRQAKTRALKQDRLKHHALIHRLKFEEVIAESSPIAPRDEPSASASRKASKSTPAKLISTERDDHLASLKARAARETAEAELAELQSRITPLENEINQLTRQFWVTKKQVAGQNYDLSASRYCDVEH